MSRYSNFFYSGFVFDESEDLLKFKFKMINYIFVLVSFFSLLFAVMSDLGLNEIGIYAKVDYVYSFLTFCLIFLLRMSKNNYILTARLLLTFSMTAFTLALILVPQDEFRLIWFYLTVLVAYILGGIKDGLFFTTLAIFLIVLVSSLIDVQLSGLAINSAVLGLIIGSSISLIYANKINSYEASLRDRNKEFEKMAATDGLTGIMNKRSFEEISEKYFESAQRHGYPITVVMIDLDHFKTINDTYGHAVGDKVLVSFVKNVKKIVRSSDVFARVGGEEFAMILFNTSMNESQTFCDHFFNAVKDVRVLHDNDEIKITVSTGASQNRMDDQHFKDIYIRADKALYQAKKEGRNRMNIVS